MNDEDIKKSLFEIAEKAANRDDIYFDGHASTELSKLLHNALDLIYRQQAEIERLNNCVKSEDEVRAIATETIRECTKIIKSEAIKEFAERLRLRVIKTRFDAMYGAVIEISNDTITELVKEMVGG